MADLVVEVFGAEAGVEFELGGVRHDAAEVDGAGVDGELITAGRTVVFEVVTVGDEDAAGFLDAAESEDIAVLAGRR